MHESLLEILAEPETRAPLELQSPTHAANGQIESGTLVSTQTGAEYPIVRGIPRFVSPENYADSFGFQWNEFRNVQLDSVRGVRVSEERFDNETTWTQADLEGKLVLDAGCGAGRFAEIAAERGARVVGLDLSSAVEATARTISGFEGVNVVQGSILAPPFRPGVFDFAYSLGVLQHTPDPVGAIGRIVECVASGGRYAFTIYARQPWTKLNTKYLVRPLTKRLPTKVLLRGIEVVMPVGFPVADRLFRLPVLGRVAQFTIPLAVYVDRDDLSREDRYQEAILDTFDMLAPAYDSPLTWRETIAALRQLGVREIDFRSRVPVNVIGAR